MVPRRPPRRRAAVPRRHRLLTTPPPDPVPTAAPRWGLGDVAVGLIPIYLAAASALAAGAAGEGDTEITAGALVVGSAFYWIFFIGVPWFATTRKGNGLVADLRLRLRPLDPFWGFALGAVIQAIVIPLLYVPIFWILKDYDATDVSNDARDLTDAFRGAGVLVLVLVVVVGAPIAEEIFFRGFMLRALERRLGTTPAIVIQAVVFGLSHLQGIQLPALILFGLILGLLATRTGRLGPGIFAHMGFNAWTVFTLVVLDWV